MIAGQCELNISRHYLFELKNIQICDLDDD